MPDRYADSRQIGFADLDDLTWYSSEPLGHNTSLGLVSAGPVAVIAGFVLAASITAATASAPELLDVAAVFTFSLSATVLFATLAHIVEANASYATPGDRLAWYPEAQISEAILDALRQRQRRDFARYYFMRRRALILYPIGSALAILGLALVLFARVDGDRLGVQGLEDAAVDTLSLVGGTGLVATAAYLLSFSPAKVFNGVNGDRDERALRRGMTLLGWTSLDEVGKAPLGKLALLKEAPD